MHEHDQADHPGAVRCEVCDRVSRVSEQGWRGYLGVSDDDRLKVVLYCPDCLEELLVGDP